MAGIERGTPDVSIAREMDTPLHRVLLSGLVYVRARLTAGPWLNRRCEAHTGPPRVWVFTWILLTPSCSLSSPPSPRPSPLRSSGKLLSNRAQAVYFRRIFEHGGLFDSMNSCVSVVHRWLLWEAGQLSEMCFQR